MLKRSSDRKVTNAVTPSGKSSAINNTFGLPSGTRFSCPGATSFCDGICYAGQIEKQYVAVKDILMHNWHTILEADYLYGIAGMYSILSGMVSDFVADCDKRDIHNAKRGLKPVPRAFRIHWDGDFFSRDYAQAWAYVAMSFPDITFWVYTRSFDCVPDIAGISNLTVYCSADIVNHKAAYSAAADNDVNVALVDMTFAAARSIMDRYAGRKVYNCPENGKRIPLISTKGSACITCGVCVIGRGDVAFSVKKK